MYVLLNNEDGVCDDDDIIGREGTPDLFLLFAFCFFAFLHNMWACFFALLLCCFFYIAYGRAVAFFALLLFYIAYIWLAFLRFRVFACQ